MTLLKKVPAVAALFCLIMVAGCKSPAKPAEIIKAEDFGPMPQDWRAQVQKALRAELRKSESTELRCEMPATGQFRKGNSAWKPAWKVKAWVRSRDSSGEYAKPQPYWFFFRGGKIVYKVKPSEVPEDEWNAL